MRKTRKRREAASWVGGRHWSVGRFWSGLPLLLQDRSWRRAAESPAEGRQAAYRAVLIDMGLREYEAERLRQNQGRNILISVVEANRSQREGVSRFEELRYLPGVSKMIRLKRVLRRTKS